MYKYFRTTIFLYSFILFLSDSSALLFFLLDHSLDVGECKAQSTIIAFSYISLRTFCCALPDSSNVKLPVFLTFVVAILTLYHAQ